MYKTLPLLLSLLITACSSAVAPAVPISPPITFTPRPTSPPPPCSAPDIAPTPGSDQPSLFPPVSNSDHVFGPSDAAVTVLEYSDFQCPTCAGLAPVLALLAIEHPQDFRIVFRHFPLLDKFDKSALAAQAAEAAAGQGKFWEMHDLLYGKLSEWNSMTPDDFEAWLVEQAPAAGLDAAQFRIELTSEAVADRVHKAWEDGTQTGIPYAPFLLINGQIYTGPSDYNSLNQIVSLILLGNRQFSNCPPMTVDPLKQYVATLQTAKGDIVIQLFADKAPWAVNSFIFLARSGWYDNITFYRVIPGFVAQTGDPSGTGLGNPGYMFINEIDPSLRFDKAGMVGMANSAPDTNGSQFFITYGPAPHLDGNHTIFGQVILGMDVLAQLAARSPAPGKTLPPGDILIRVTILER